MNNNENIDNKVVKELNLEELKQATGGCFFSHSLVRTDFKYVGNDLYEMFKCEDCGEEHYYKNNSEIQPSDYYRACYGF